METPASCGAFPQVGPFLVEALQNPRHRLTVLRMELDIQRFMQNPDQHQFEFQHFPTSYLRCAAHRVAQYYGLQTMVLDKYVDGSGSRILVTKTPESRFPSVYLSSIPAKQDETEKIGQVKIAIRARPSRTSSGDVDAQETKISCMRSMEERKEEYDKARARIFSGCNSPEAEDPSFVFSDNERSTCESPDEQECCRTWIEEHDKVSIKDGASKVAIFRDREKDRSDPDYDRSYDRYTRSSSFGPSFSLGACNVVQPPLLQCEPGFSQLAQLPRVQTSVSYRPSNPVMNPFCDIGCNQTPYIQWPSSAMLYAHSYEHFRHAVFQAPFCQQPLTFERSQNH